MMTKQSEVLHSGEAKLALSLAELTMAMVAAPDLGAAVRLAAASVSWVAPEADWLVITRLSRRRHVVLAAAAPTVSPKPTSAGSPAGTSNPLADVFAGFRGVPAVVLDPRHAGLAAAGPALAASERRQRPYRQVDLGGLPTPDHGPASDWRTELLAAGCRSLLTVDLGSESRPFGVLALGTNRPGVLCDRLDAVLLFAAQLSVALTCQDERLGLQQAVQARHHIGQAQGVLMNRYKITAETAFATMVRLSQDNNVKVRDVATEVITTGTLPDPVRAAAASAGKPDGAARHSNPAA